MLAVFAGNASIACIMAQITIRKLDDEIVKRLRIRAAEAGHSMEEEARRVLARSLGVDREALRERFRKLRAESGPPRGPSAVEMVREMRDRAPRGLSGKPQRARR
jgi:plasmid stability protein